MTNEEAAKKLVHMYGELMVKKEDVNGTYAEAVAMGAAALIYSKEVKTDANTNWNSGSNLR